MCEGFPANKAYWRLDDAESDSPTVYINWGKFGEYELKIAPDGESMVGSAKGQPDNWRKAERTQHLSEASSKKRGREGCGGCKKGCGDCGRENDA